MKNFMRLWVLLAAVAIVSAIGCSKSDGAKESGTEAATEQPAKAEPAKAEPAKAEPAKAEPAKAEPAKVEPPKVEAKATVSKESLAKAYEEIYCAQKKGRTDAILDIYKKYGFASPKEWTEAWTATSSDTEWQTALTKRIQALKCE